jgi:hypothetical protein
VLLPCWFVATLLVTTSWPWFQQRQRQRLQIGRSCGPLPLERCFLSTRVCHLLEDAARVDLYTLAFTWGAHRAGCPLCWRCALQPRHQVALGSQYYITYINTAFISTQHVRCHACQYLVCHFGGVPGCKHHVPLSWMSRPALRNIRCGQRLPTERGRLSSEVDSRDIATCCDTDAHSHDTMQVWTSSEAVPPLTQWGQQCY